MPPGHGIYPSIINESGSAMAILKIARMGHPVLRRRAQEVDLPIPGYIRQLAMDMIETMVDASGVGLAAPQVHIGSRIIVFRVPADRSSGAAGDQPAEAQALINPVVEPLTEELAFGWEGCLSIPGLRGMVPRHTRIRYSGLAPDGTRVEREASGFHARVIQHEMDHLDGILYLDRMPDMRLLTFQEEMKYFGPETLPKN